MVLSKGSGMHNWLSIPSAFNRPTRYRYPGPCALAEGNAVPAYPNGWLNAALWEISAYKGLLHWACLDSFPEFKTQYVIILGNTTWRELEKIRKCVWEATGWQVKGVHFDVLGTWSPLIRCTLSSWNPQSPWNSFINKNQELHGKKWHTPNKRWVPINKTFPPVFNLPMLIWIPTYLYTSIFLQILE